MTGSTHVVRGSAVKICGCAAISLSSNVLPVAEES